MLQILAPSLLSAILVAGCASPSTSPQPTPISGAPESAGAPEPSGASTASPSPASIVLPVRESAREISDRVVQTAPGPGGGLYVSIPARGGGTLLALLDSTGRPGAGWPVVLDEATSCDNLLPVDDGSVRVICTRQNPDGNMFSPMGAFAFDSNGRMVSGWPVVFDGSYVAGRVIGTDLTLFESWPLGDVIEPGQPTTEGGLVTIAANGALSNGVRVPMGEACACDVWAVGLDGVAYGIGLPKDPPESSRITAVDVSGLRAGWPLKIDDITSRTAFGPGGRTVVLLGSLVRSTSRVLVFDDGGQAASASSEELPIVTVEPPSTGGCLAGSPQSPLVAQDGTIFVFSEIDSAVFALDSSLKVVPGWPYQPPTPLVRLRPGFEYEHEAGFCAALGAPAVGPDSTVYLPLQARDATVGGSIVAVGPDGLVRNGWPVELQLPGAEFWSVVVGSDGTVHALAIEPEPNGESSASLMAIAADGTVLATTTIIEP